MNYYQNFMTLCRISNSKTVFTNCHDGGINHIFYLPIVIRQYQPRDIEG